MGLGIRTGENQDEQLRTMSTKAGLNLEERQKVRKIAKYYKITVTHDLGT
jgi:hypothetical protein